MKLLLLLLLAAWPVLQAQDPPHIVQGRGEVTILRGDAAQPVAAPLDSPLAAGDRIVTGRKGRATVQLDPSHNFRLDPNSELRIVYAENDTYQITLWKGSLAYWVAPGSAASVSVD